MFLSVSSVQVAVAFPWLDRVEFWLIHKELPDGLAWTAFLYRVCYGAGVRFDEFGVLQRRHISVAVTGITVDEGRQVVYVTVSADLS